MGAGACVLPTLRIDRALGERSTSEGSTVRFTASQYDRAIEALREAREQLAPDGLCCRICHDSGHQAWECGHNPLLAMATCEGVAQAAVALHDRLHTIEDAMNEIDQSEAIADWRESAHDLLHHLGGYDTTFGRRVGPGSVSVPEAADQIGTTR